MSQKTTQLPVVFTEIWFNEQKADRHGQINTQNLILKAKGLLTDTVKEHSGKIVKTEDNRFFCTYPNTKKALQAAMSQHQTIEAQSLLGNIEIKLRSGIHYGDVKISKDDVMGGAVSAAKAIQSVSEPDQILLSKEAMKQISNIMGIPFRRVGKVKVKESLLKIEVYEADWLDQTEEHTVLLDEDPRATASDSVLVVKFLGKKHKLSKSRTSFLFGRSNQNDIILDNSLVSRGHAAIKYDAGRFKLIDHSSNGTYLQTSEKKDFFLHNQEMVLEGKGVFALGKKIEKRDPNLVYYAVINK